MKKIENNTENVNIINDYKKEEILSLIKLNWNNFFTASELGKHLENGYIFGTYGVNEHYNINDFIILINNIEQDLQKIEQYKSGEIIKSLAEYDENGIETKSIKYYAYTTDKQMLKDLELIDKDLLKL